LENEVARLRRDSEVNAAGVARLVERVERLIHRMNELELTRRIGGTRRKSPLTVEQILDLAG